MEGVFSKENQRVYWCNISNSAKSWIVPECAINDNYEPSTKQIKSSVNVHNWRLECNNVKQEMHTLHVKKGHVHLDLCCGRGGDIHKFSHNAPEMLIGIDVSPLAIEEAVKRHALKSNLNARFFVSNLADASTHDAILYKLRKYKFSSVSVMFAIHYMCESAETFESFISFLQRLNTCDDCVVYGICPDWVTLSSVFRGKADAYQPIRECKIRPSNKLPSNMSEDNCFGLKYSFFLNGLVETRLKQGVDEYLVYWPVLESKFKKCGWRCEYINRAKCGDGLYVKFCLKR